MEKLPKRSDAKPNLISNLIPLCKLTPIVLYQYSVKFTPQPSPTKKKHLFMLLEQQILKEKETLAIAFYEHMYSTLGTLNKKNIYITLPQDLWMADLILQKTLSLNGQNAQLSADSRQIIRIIKNLLSRTLKNNSYFEIGRSSVFIDVHNKTKIQDMNVFQFQGYQIKINLQKQLMVLPTIKLVRAESVLSLIKDIYQANYNLEKAQKRSIVTEKMIGCNIMTNYGNGKNTLYRISGLDYQHTILSKDLLENGSTLKQYYKTKYNIDIKDQKQPLLVAAPKKKLEKSTILLVPELCIMVGLGFLKAYEKAQIAKKTMKNPNQVYQRNNNFLKVLKQANIDKVFELEYQQFSSKILNFPLIQIGDRKFELQGSGNIKIFNKKIHKPENKRISISIFHIMNQTLAKQISNLMRSTCSGLNYPIELNINELKAEQLKEEMYLNNFKDKYVTYLLILPKTFQHLYSKFKRFCDQSAVVSQVVLESKMATSKNLFSFIGKVALQILSKNGVCLWNPQTKIKQKENVMMAGIMIERSKTKGSLVVVSKINWELNQYRSQFKRLNSSKDNSTSDNIIGCIKNAIKQFQRFNKEVPKMIIILRQGENDSQQIDDINWKQLIEIPYCTKVTDIIVNDHSALRFYKKNSSLKIDNPEIGTVVETSECEFQLFSQINPMRVSKPIVYKIKNMGEFSKQELQSIVFSECFNYFNWSGPVQVPSVLQYCRKLLNYVGATGTKDNLFFGHLTYL